MKRQSYSIEESIRELERELEMRKSVYPRWIQVRNIDRDVAKRRIYCIERAIALLRKENIDKMIRFGEVIGELRRELQFREKIYPKWLSSGKISGPVARRQYGALQAAIGYLVGEDLNPDVVQGNLFPGSSHTHIDPS